MRGGDAVERHRDHESCMFACLRTGKLVAAAAEDYRLRTTDVWECCLFFFTSFGLQYMRRVLSLVMVMQRQRI